MTEGQGCILVPAPIPFYLPLSPRLDFFYVLALVRGIEVAWLRTEGLDVPSDLAGALSGLPAWVIARSAGIYRWSLGGRTVLISCFS